eukprot:GFUD01016292.1.p1 GENE.GFUD01016292.1~~GFUD01016292.1.p1  ORF type:complete len:349 (-),score=110.13 GFUD01016292.1:157-1203(-)
MVEVLLPEIWNKIFTYLNKTDLCNVLLTCRYLYCVGSDPLIWANTSICKERISPTSSLQFLLWPRFSRLSSLNLSDSELGTQSATNLFKIIPQLLNLKHVNLSHTNLSAVCPTVLCSAVHLLESISLQQTRLTINQVEAVLVTLSTSSNHLVSLNLARTDLSKVPPDILAHGLATVLRVNISSTQLNPDQTRALFDIFSTPNNKLKHLIVREVDLSTANLDSLAKGVASLITVNLQETKLGMQQCNAIFSHISSSSSLISINLSHVTLAGVPADLLARAIQKLDRAGLNWTQLTAHQLTKLLDIKNKRLVLQLEGVNWDGVPAQLVVKYKMRGCFNIFRRHISSPGSL